MGRPETKITTNCDFCHKEIKIIRFKLAHSKHHYCSARCQYNHRKILPGNRRGIPHSEKTKAYLSKIRIGKKHPLSERGIEAIRRASKLKADPNKKAIYRCTKCGKERIHYKSIYDGSSIENPFCSRACSTKYYQTGKPRTKSQILAVTESNKRRIWTEKSRLKMSQSNSLEKNGNWRGGISYEPYGVDWNKKLKRAVKNRDGCCLICNVSFDDLKLLKRVVNVHHIDYDKNNNIPQNLVSLCVKCHGLTNGNRKHWKEFFHRLLTERYDYEYINGKIIIELGGKNV